MKAPGFFHSAAALCMAIPALKTRAADPLPAEIAGEWPTAMGDLKERLGKWRTE
jgi:hypothetical protein